MSNWIIKTDSGFVESKEISLRENTSVKIGRDAQCDIVIKKPEISRFHAEIIYEEGKGVPTLRDLGSSNGTFINQSKIGESAVDLHNDDIIQFEEISFEVVNQGSDYGNKTIVGRSIQDEDIEKINQKKGNTMLQKNIESITSLDILQGNSKSAAHFNLDAVNIVVIGRFSSCDIMLDDQMVSGEHAKLSYQNNIWSVDNLSQTNGVFVNGDKINHVKLKDGDKIELGNCTLQFNTKLPGDDIDLIESNTKIPDWMRDQDF